MTNRMIILLESVKLMDAGIIGTTGRSIEVKDKEGNIKKLAEPEPIHTYAGWKEIGYQVKKGEHAIAKFTIWKMAGKKKQEIENADADGEGSDSRMFMKLSHWFKRSQVEKIEA